MAKKKKTLPKDFKELLSKNNFKELISVFDDCEVDARGDYAKQTALAYDNCSHELAKWLVEHGADLQATDTWNNTPLHKRSRSRFGNIKSLLELGADVNVEKSSIGTPLHAAADSHNIENTKLLLEYGGNINALNSGGYSPLEQALKTCNNINIINTVNLSKIYIDAGVHITLKMKEFVTEIGKQFEFHSANFNKDFIIEVSTALEELYKLFDVMPVAKRILHDGQFPIIVKEDIWQNQFQTLWDLLVPSNGHADTVQGEVIRIAGRIDNELEGNGGVNWDADYKKMADSFIVFVHKGNQLTHSETESIKSIIAEIKQKTGNTSKLCELGVRWVINNPIPIKLSSVAYKR